MSNFNNMYTSCPPLMSDGRTSVLTDYRPKNDAFFAMKKDTKTSYLFRDQLQISGVNDMKDIVKYNLCTTIPYGTVIYDTNINMSIDNNGSFLDAFKSLKN